ncbi:ABC transporter ATP-binding protein [Chondromyces crocatus]|uniref:ABC transporter ATP-binding protein n=1 Tax=Chondromyces crocatus TaxID=52 RepID=A0A0K1EHR8_CHOCO|nr:ATP-binding cassette domain-containing protein [Chondromyces crocatus]AKT40227.1 ABC transporter ATP-binding protein [Chondromyces crocatus]
MSEPRIEVDDLTMGWGDNILQKNASFQVKRGDIFAILGGSGCGKSTMLRYLVGLETPMGGRITIQGIGAPRLQVGRPKYGVMFQSGALFGSMTVGENVALQLRKWTDLPDDAIDAIVRAKLQLVGLGGVKNHMPSEISGGMKKRAAIARAMALEPDLIFLDEPSAGLDPVSSFELDELILTLNRSLGLTVVIVTHELESIFKIVKTCVMLDKESKSIIARGDPRQLRDESRDPRVHSFFNRTNREGT